MSSGSTSTRPKAHLVLCVDEKTQIQALDRTQPTLPMKPGKAQRMTHDYKRNGTTSLYAALEIATGEVTGACYPQHRHQEFLAFLNQLVELYPRRPLHVVLDNSSTHSTPEVERWLERHKRVHFHFTPTGASWMNMVEIWFSILTNQQVRRGTYNHVPELITAIEQFIAGYNQRAQPFVWTKTPEQILAKAIKQQATSETLHYGATAGYTDTFLVNVNFDERSAEAWGRLILERAPAALRLSLPPAWASLGLRHGPLDSPDHVLGWPIRNRTQDHMLLGAVSRLGMPAELLLARYQGALLFATVIRFERAAMRAVWFGIERPHKRTVRTLLTHAIRRAE